MDNTLLTPKQKRANHIASEQRRRQAIREAFDLITGVVPNLDQRESRSEAIVLTKTVDYLLRLKQENCQLVEALSDGGEDTGPDSTRTHMGNMNAGPNGEPRKSKVPMELRADYDKDLPSGTGSGNKGGA